MNKKGRAVASKEDVRRVAAALCEESCGESCLCVKAGPMCPVMMGRAKAALRAMGFDTTEIGDDE